MPTRPAWLPPVAEKFSVVTGGAAWVPILEEFFETLGYRARIASIRPVAATGAEIATNPEVALAGLAAEVNACIHDGAQAVIIGGAWLAGVAARIATRVRVPLIDSVAAGVTQAEALRVCTFLAQYRDTGIPTIVISTSHSGGLSRPAGQFRKQT